MEREIIKALGFVLLVLGVLVITGLMFFAALQIHPLLAVFFVAVLCVFVGGFILDQEL